MEGLSHFIITRFNLPLKNEMTSKYIDRIDVQVDKEYLDRRFELFFKYTVPSMKNQNCDNYSWLVLFSKKTPQKYKKIIERLEKEFVNFYPVYINTGENSKIIVKSIIEESFTPKDHTCITTRLDNDDAVRYDFVEKIQKSTKNEKVTGSVLVFPNGFQYDQKKKIVTKYYFPDNHFSSLIDKKENFSKTILDYNHMEITSLFNTIFLNEKTEMWMEIVHNGNLLNRMFLNKRNIRTEIMDFSSFGLNEYSKSITRLEMYILVILNRPQNGIRLLCQYGLRKSCYKILRKLIKK